MTKIPFSVSCFDIEHVLSQAGLSLAGLTKEQVDSILHYVGMDLKGLEKDECIHRPKFSPNNEPWFGERFTGFERQDREWMTSAKCSLENVIAAQDDATHKRDLLGMSARSNNTAEICGAMEKFRPANPEQSI